MHGLPITHFCVAQRQCVNMCGAVMNTCRLLFGKHQGIPGHGSEGDGGTDFGLGWSGSGEGVMATFNPLVTLGFEFQLLP